MRTIPAPSFAIKSIQEGSIAMAAGDTSKDATITSVTVANCILQVTGFHVGGFSLGDQPYIQLIGATTVRAYKVLTSVNAGIYFRVMELYPGIIKRNQQAINTIAASSAFQNTTITSVNVNKSLLIHLGCSCDYGPDWSGALTTFMSLSTSTTVGVSRTTAYGSPVYTGLQVVEFY